MTTADRQFLGKTWFAVTAFVCWNSLRVLYGIFVPGKTVDFPIIGPQTYSERAVLGIPLLFAGYCFCYTLAFVVLRKGKAVDHPDVPSGATVSRRFFQSSFWILMGVQVIVIVWALVPLFKIDFTSTAGEVLKGWKIFSFRDGNWWGRVQDGRDTGHSSVWPGYTPVLYCLLVVGTVISYGLLPFLNKKPKNEQVGLGILARGL